MKTLSAKVVAALLVTNSTHQGKRLIVGVTMAAMISACCGPAQQILYNYVNHSRGFFTGDYVRAASLSNNDQAPKPALIYLAFVDGTYNHPVQIAPSAGLKDSDAKDNTSWLINSLQEARLRTTNSPVRIIDHFDPVPQTEEFKTAVVSELEKIFREYQVTFTLKRPPATSALDYTMIVIGKRAADLADFSVRSYAPWDPGNKFHNDVAFVFNRGLNAVTDAIEIAHAIGHTFGLQDVAVPGFIMSHSGSAWADRDVPVPSAFEMYGRKREDPCHASVPKKDTVTFQNDKVLLAKVIPMRPRPWDPKTELSRFQFRNTLCASSRDNSIKLSPPKKDDYIISEDGTITTISLPLVAYTDYRMWKPGDRIYVQINDEPKLSHLRELIHDRIRKYASIWEVYANIKFEFDKPPGKDEKNVIIVGFDSLQTSNSKIGREITFNSAKTPTMNINTFFSHRLYKYYPELVESDYRTTILHEFGHSLGLVHEHQSPLNEVKWNVDTLYKDYGKEKADINFLEIPDKKHVNYTKYDPLSIMHYSYSARSTTDGSSAKPNFDLSEMDREGIKMIYPRTKNPRGILVPDPCDQVQFQIDYGAFGGDTTIFVLIFARPEAGETRLSKWKGIGIPIVNGEHKLSIEGDRTVWTKTFDFDELNLKHKAITFWKKSPIGTEVRLPYSWPLGHALKPGSRVTFTWIRDSCN